jgi:hypothetical protein
MKRFEEKLGKDLYTSTQLQGEVSLSAKLEAIKNSAERRAKELRDETITNSERKANRQENRKSERDKLRKEQSYELGKTTIRQEYDETEIPDEAELAVEYKPRSKIDLLSQWTRG